MKKNTFSSQTLGPQERERIELGRKELRRVPAGGSGKALFDAISKCTPVVGGLIGHLGRLQADTQVSHAVSLPNEVLEGWWSAPREQIGLMLAPLVTAVPGQLISDTQAIVGEAREQFALLSLLRAHGLGEAAGYKVGRATERGFLFMTFALEKGRTFRAQDRHVLQALQGEIQAAVSRMALPLIPSQPMMAQIMDDRSMGFLCINEHGQCIEWNEKGRQLCLQYQNAASVQKGRDLLNRFAEHVRKSPRSTKGFTIWHETQRSYLEVRIHNLAKETHSLGQDLSLLTLEEKAAESDQTLTFPREFTAREREIARLLVETADAQKTIADNLGIKPNTVRTHSDRIHKKANVSTRLELATFLRKRR